MRNITTKLDPDVNNYCTSGLYNSAGKVKNQSRPVMTCFLSDEWLCRYGCVSDNHKIIGRETQSDKDNQAASARNARCLPWYIVYR